MLSEYSLYFTVPAPPFLKLAICKKKWDHVLKLPLYYYFFKLVLDIMRLSLKKFKWVPS